MENDNLIKVLHCVGHMKRAGAETFIMNVYRNINREKIQFDFLCLEKKDGDYDREISQLGGNLFYVDLNKYLYSGILKYLGKYYAYRDAFSECKNHYVHIHGHHAFDIWLVVIAAKHAGIKRIYVHSHNTYAPHPVLNSFFSKLLNKTKIEKLACGNDAGQWLFGENSKFKTVYNGIDTEKFKFSPQDRMIIRTEFGATLDSKILLNVGRFEEQKNQEFLIRIFNEYYKYNNNAMLVLVGQGERLNKIKQEVSELDCKDNVIFTGIRDDISTIMSACDLFIMPSLFEGFPVTGIEAQACGLPCIFSDVVTREVKINDNVRFVSLSDSPLLWTKYIDESESLPNNREIAHVRIKDRGFDIKDTASKLQMTYLI